MSNVQKLDAKVESFLSQFSTPTVDMLKLELAARLEKDREYDHFETLKEILDNAEELIVCGSWAIGCPRPDSDFDIVAILPDGFKYKRHMTHRLDIVPFSRKEADGREWSMKPGTHRGSQELFNNISKYGIWIKGTEDRQRYTGECTKSYIKQKIGWILENACKQYLYFKDRKDIQMSYKIEFIFTHLMALDWIQQGRVIPGRTVLKWEALQTKFEYLERMDDLLGKEVRSLIECLIPVVSPTFRMNAYSLFLESWSKDLESALSSENL